MKKVVVYGGLLALLLGAFLAIQLGHAPYPSVHSNSVERSSAPTTVTGSHATASFISAKLVAKPDDTHSSDNKRVPFRLDNRVRDKFELFIAEHSEKAPLTVKLAFVKSSLLTYTEETHDYAVDLFGRYVDYKVALADENVEIDTVNFSLQDIRIKLDERVDIRLQFFSKNEYDYLFGQDEHTDNEALSRLAIAQDDTLSRAQKKDAIIESLAVASDRDAFKPTIDIHKIKKIKQQYKDNNSRFSAISAEFGDEVAQRFVELWSEQEEWEKKIEGYRLYLAQLNNNDVSKEALHELLREYEEQHFTSNELKRVKVLVSRKDPL